jgi:hypothetical protein
MMSNAAHFDHGDLVFHIEPGMPCFLDGFDVDPDDPGDWWLDLGSVDLSLVPGV